MVCSVMCIGVTKPDTFNWDYKRAKDAGIGVERQRLKGAVVRDVQGVVLF